MSRPTTLPTWATSLAGLANRVSPGGVSADGFAAGMRFPATWADFLFGWILDWVNYFADTAPRAFANITTNGAGSFTLNESRGVTSVALNGSAPKTIRVTVTDAFAGQRKYAAIATEQSAGAVTLTVSQISGTVFDVHIMDAATGATIGAEVYTGVVGVVAVGV
jgi:hypothetical protein